MGSQSWNSPPPSPTANRKNRSSVHWEWIHLGSGRRIPNSQQHHLLLSKNCKSTSNRITSAQSPQKHSRTAIHHPLTTTKVIREFNLNSSTSSFTTSKDRRCLRSPPKEAAEGPETEIDGSHVRQRSKHSDLPGERTL